MGLAARNCWRMPPGQPPPPSSGCPPCGSSSSTPWRRMPSSQARSTACMGGGARGVPAGFRAAAAVPRQNGFGSLQPAAAAGTVRLPPRPAAPDITDHPRQLHPPHRTCAACATHCSLLAGRGYTKSPSRLSSRPGPSCRVGSAAGCCGAASAGCCGCGCGCGTACSAGAAAALLPSWLLAATMAAVEEPATSAAAAAATACTASVSSAAALVGGGELSAAACAPASRPPSSTSITITRLRDACRAASSASAAAAWAAAWASAAAALSWGQARLLCPSSPQCPHFFFWPALEWRRPGLRACASRIARAMLLRVGRAAAEAVGGWAVGNLAVSSSGGYPVPPH